MSADSDFGAVLDRAVSQAAAASQAPPVETILRAARRGKTRRAALTAIGAAAGAAVLVGVGLTFVPQADPGGTVVQTPPEPERRIVGLSPGSARIVDAQSRLRHLPSAGPASGGRSGRVLASAPTSKGEIVLLDVQLPNGLRCVLQQYANPATAGGGGGRCGDAASPPYSGPGVDVSANQETTPGGTNVSVVYGAAPPSSTRVELHGDDGEAVSADTTHAGPEYAHRAFFVAVWPVPRPVTVIAFTADRTETGRSSLTF